MLQEEMEALNLPSPAPKSIFNNQIIQDYITKCCPRVYFAYKSLSNIYSNLNNHPQSLQFQNWSEEIIKIIESIAFEPKPSVSLVCGRQLTEGYYECYDCRKSDVSCYCESCFEYEKHRGHMFAFIEIEEGVGFCDCGDVNLLKTQGLCSKHQNILSQPINEREVYSQSQDLRFLISFSCAVAKQKQANLFISDREFIFSLVLEKIKDLIKDSNYYQMAVTDVLMSEPINGFDLPKEQIIKTLIQYFWSSGVQCKIAEILWVLYKYQKIKLTALPLIFHLISNYGSVFKIKAALLTPFIRSATNEHSIIQKLVNKQTIKDLVINECVTSCQSVDLIACFYQTVHDVWPEYFLNIAYLLIQQVPVLKWLNFLKLSQTYSNQQVNDAGRFMYKFLKWIFKAFKSGVNEDFQKKVMLKKLIGKSFQATLSLKQNGEFYLNRIFTLSLLIFLDFKVNKLQEMPSSQFSSLFEVQQFTSATIFDSLIVIVSNISNLSADESQAALCPSKFDISLDFLYFQMLSLIFERMQKEKNCHQHGILSIIFKNTISQIKLKQMKKESQKQVFINLLKIAFLIKNFIFATESEVLQTLVHCEIDEEETFFQLQTLIIQIATIHKNKSKVLFKNTAQQWIKNAKMVKQFLINQYEQFQKIETNIEMIESNLSFNSYLCQYESYQARQMRFKAKFREKQYQKQHIQVLDEIEGEFETIELLFHQIIQLLVNEKDLKRLWIPQIINEWFQMLMTFYLASKSEKSKNLINQVISNTEILSVLNNKNQEIVKIYKEELRTEKQEKRNLFQDQKQMQDKIKKKNKMEALKERQRKVMNEEKIKNQLIVGTKVQDQCIICKMGEEKQSLHYLCHITQSNTLMRSILNSSQTFLLLTTCGHLIHESCLNQSLDQSKAYQQSYNCFLCKKISNLRLPLNHKTIAQENAVKQLMEQIAIILSLQAEKQSESYKKLPKSSSENVQSEEKKETASKQFFGQQLYDAMFYQIYFYYLAHSRLYVNYMLPIFPSLISVLRQEAKEKQVASFSLSGEKTVEPQLQASIEEHLNRTIKGEWIQHFLEEEFGGMEAEVQLMGDEKVQIAQVTQLFKKINVESYPEPAKIKKLQRFNFKVPPSDLTDLKRMVRPCPQCGRLYDKMKFCLLCEQATCHKCELLWKTHIVEIHKGNSVSTTLRSGACQYESLERVSKFKSFYKDYLGQWYNQEVINIKNDEYLLDEDRYEQVLVDIVMDYVEGKQSTYQNGQSNIECLNQ